MVRTKPGLKTDRTKIHFPLDQQSTTPAVSPPPATGRMPAGVASQLRRFALAVVLLGICFAIPLCKLFRFAAASELYSYILLIPFISAYLLWLKRGNLPVTIGSSRTLAAAFILVGTTLLCAYWLWLRPGLFAATEDYLMTMTLCFLLFLYGISSLFWGVETICAAAFPLGFLILLAPIPPAGIQELDSFLQWGSAIVASGFFSLSGTSFFRDGVAFQLPDIKLAIAPECSGIHSTVVLFITALLSGYIFLRTPWKRAVLVLFIVPLGLFRNGFRVFVIGQLCIHMGPQMINSPIHRKGGPIFFVLSLIPLFLVLLVLQRSEKRSSGQISKIQDQSCAN
jgi:exosortase C (VPDSG-CTERM-specific)